MKLLQVLLSLLVAGLSASLCQAAAIEVRGIWHGAVGEEPAGLSVVAVAADENATEIEAELDPALDASLELAPGVWRIKLRDPKIWSPERLLSVKGDAASIALDLYPTGIVRGQLEMLDRNAARPESLSVRFRGSLSRTEHELDLDDGAGEPGGDAAPTIGDALPAVDDTAHCPVTDAGWSCRVPAGHLDLRVRAAGFISHYFWDENLRAEKTLDLGSLRLRRGASVVGFVATADGAPLPENLEIELVPRVAGAVDAGTAKRLAALAASAPIEERGFFHVQGVAPGSYEARIEAAGRVPLRTTPIQVVEGSESELDEPLLLARPLKLEVSVEPPLDLNGERWRMLLIDTDSTVPLSSGVADLDGRLEFGDLRPGELILEVSDGFHNRVAIDFLRLEPPGAEHRVTLDMVEVEGRLRLGEEPLACGVHFGRISGGVEVPLESDEDGLFSGILPRAGEWPVDVRCDEPSVFRRLPEIRIEKPASGKAAWIDIELPDTWLEGEVVDRDGRPVPGAGVLAIQAPASERPFFVRSGEDGTFTFRGLATGRYYLQARVEAGGGSTLESARLLVSAEEKKPGALHRLELRGRTIQTGSVRSAVGPVVGAEIAARPIDSPALFMPTARTGPTGDFSLSLPEGTSRLDVTVMAPGFLLFRQDHDVAGSTKLDIALAQTGGGELTVLGLLPAGSFYKGVRVLIGREGDRRYSPSTLSRWARMNGSPGLPDQLTIPNLPAGHYQACLVIRGEAEEKRCTAGFLPPSGQLELPVPKLDIEEESSENE